MTARPAIPGLVFSVAPRPPEPSPLRSDVAGFIGATERGPVGVAVRVEGEREYRAVFGGLTPGADLPHAIRGYFANGGEVAHVVRVAATAGAAAAEWVVAEADPMTGLWSPLAPVESGLGFARYRVEAATPGTWANGVRVQFRYLRQGLSGGPELDVVVDARGSQSERHRAVVPAELVQRLASRSRLIRLGGTIAAAASPDPDLVGPRYHAWIDADGEPEVILAGGTEVAATAPEYLAALVALGDVPEVALVAMPDLHRHLTAADERLDVLQQAVEGADRLLDRLVLVDIPDRDDPRDLLDWVDTLRARFPGREPTPLRTCGVYHPGLTVEDPLGGVARPTRRVPACGHVAGVISRLDRERGAHHTPANAEVYDAFDGEREYTDAEQGLVNPAGINLVRCLPGRGLNVWGGRTLDTADDRYRWVAHRRLIHRLVRAIRRVAEPLVFDTNGPELWLALSRAVTTVLLEAFRAGGLVGERPEEGFRVQCDEATNPPEERDLGRCLCRVQLAPAVPMEFIELRIAVARDGAVEVIEA